MEGLEDRRRRHHGLLPGHHGGLRSRRARPRRRQSGAAGHDRALRAHGGPRRDSGSAARPVAAGCQALARASTPTTIRSTRRVYYPWIKIPGPNGRPLPVPPSGHMAGIWARSDNERGVHKAPANEVVRGALEPVTPGDQRGAGHPQPGRRELHPLLHRARRSRLGCAHRQQRSGLALHQRAAPVQLRRGIDRGAARSGSSSSRTIRISGRASSETSKRS